MSSKGQIPISIDGSKTKVVVSVSGGRTSMYMAYMLKKHFSHLYDFLFVFANTGKERPQTLEFIQRCDEYFGFGIVWLEAVISPEYGIGIKHIQVDFATANRTGKPFEDMIAKYGLPGPEAPYCSDYLKRQAIKSYTKLLEWTDHYTAIGIRADEPKRLNWARAEKNRLVYPCATMFRTTKSTVNEFWMNMPFDLELKSYEGNCDNCWKKSIRKLMTLTLEVPELTGWWQEMHDKYENFIPEGRKDNPNLKPPLRMYRDNLTMADIIEDAKLPFTPARDESKDIDMQMSLWDESLDANGGCIESCEIFSDIDMDEIFEPEEA